MEGAYSIACFGATEANWKQLAMRALRANSIRVAKNSFERLKDIKFLSLIETLENKPGAMAEASQTFGSRGSRALTGADGGQTLDLSAQAELLAYEGHYNEAAKLYVNMFRCIYFCSVVVLFHIEWYTRKPWSSSIVLYIKI